MSYIRIASALQEMGIVVLPLAIFLLLVILMHILRSCSLSLVKNVIGIFRASVLKILITRDNFSHWYTTSLGKPVPTAYSRIAGLRFLAQLYLTFFFQSYAKRMLKYFA